MALSLPALSMSNRIDGLSGRDGGRLCNEWERFDDDTFGVPVSRFDGYATVAPNGRFLSFASSSSMKAMLSLPTELPAQLSRAEAE